MQVISSTSNSIVKEIHSLHTKKGREQTGLFLIEGEKYVLEAIKSGIEVKYVAINISSGNDRRKFDGLTPVYLMEKAPFARACSTDSPTAVLAVAKKFNLHPENLIDSLKPDSLVIILEEIRDPGNLGSIIRTAAAAGIDALFVSCNSVDMFNPKVVRASAATLWKTPVVYFDSVEIITEKLKQKQFRLYSTSMGATTPYYNDIYRGNVAIMFGSEGSGLSEKYLLQAGASLAIPISDGVESLNIASSVAIILFEAKRQKEV